MEPLTLDKKIDSTKCDSFFITKCYDDYKVWQLSNGKRFPCLHSLECLYQAMKAQEKSFLLLL